MLVENTQPTPLSQAIRKGSRLHKQGFGDFVTYMNSTAYTCALGAAFEWVAGKLPPSKNDNADISVAEEIVAVTGTPILEKVKNPVTDEKGYLQSVIVNLNDKQKWSREDIAFWLEGLGY